MEQYGWRWVTGVHSRSLTSLPHDERGYYLAPLPARARERTIVELPNFVLSNRLPIPSSSSSSSSFSSSSLLDSFFGPLLSLFLLPLLLSLSLSLSPSFHARCRTRRHASRGIHELDSIALSAALMDLERRIWSGLSARDYLNAFWHF